MYKKLNANKDGFTIIEVLIVLAIAGLIMVIVFLAVPALQRNNRNTQRNNDAARIAGAISECLPNNQGDLDDCDEESELDNYAVIADNQQLVSEGSASLDSLSINTGEKCDGNSSTNVGAGARSYTITYQVETGGSPVDRCIAS